jgi:signal transduction histidine kinase
LSGTGHGLIGLRERVQEVGGQLAAGPVPGGGWRVEATLPNGRTRTHRGWPGASRRA